MKIEKSEEVKKYLRQVASIGGKAVLKKYGKEYFKQLQKKGAKVRKANKLLKVKKGATV